MRRKLKRRGEKILPPVNPNVGIAVEYRRRLQHLLDEMADSVLRWVEQAYRANEPAIAAANDEDRAKWWTIAEANVRPGTSFNLPVFGAGAKIQPTAVIMAMDATPAAELQRAIDEMTTRWTRRFGEAAPRLARYFATSARNRSDRTLMSILKKGGFTVRFKMTPVMQDVLDATIEENVGLIRSIPQKYLGEVQGMVMRSVQSGRDVGALARELRKTYGVSKRRAALIARDQNNKATAVVTRARYQEIGIEEAIWQHSHGGKEPRRTHLANSGKRYKVSQGWFDPDPKVRRRIWPGELINCRCVPRPVVKGFS